MSWEWDLQINFIINRTFKHYLTVCFVLWLAAFIMQTARCIENTVQFLRASRQWRSRSQWGHRGRNIYWFLNPSVDNEWTHILKSDCFHDEVPLEKKKIFLVIIWREGTNKDQVAWSYNSLQFLCANSRNSMDRAHFIVIFYAFHRSTMYIVGLSVKQGLYSLE